MNQYRAEHADSLNSLGPYLNYDSLIDGVNQILSHLGLRFTRVEAGRHEIWCGGVYKYVLSTGDAGGAGAGGSSLRDGSVPPETDPSTVGILYIDPFPRQHKKVQSAQFTLKGSKILDYETFALDKMGESGFLDHADPGKVLETLSMACTGRTVPRTALVCSLPEKSLTPVAAATFMHEIGHCVHSLLSRTQFQHLSGTRGVVDFVELPSHLFEHYVMDPEALTKYLGDGTGIQGASKKMLSDPSLKRAVDDFREHRTLFAHIDAAQQLYFAVLDQEFYNAPQNVTPDELHQHLKQATSQFPSLDRAVNCRGHLVENSAQLDPLTGATERRSTLQDLLAPTSLSRFEHLVHYGGTYYCYLLNKIVSSHIWKHGNYAGFDCDESGRRLLSFFRQGSVHANFGTVNDLLPAGAPRVATRSDREAEQSGGRPHWDLDMRAFVEDIRGGV